MANRPARVCSLIGVRIALLSAVILSTMLTGCTSLLSPIETIPASRVPPQFLAEPQTYKTDIDPSRLRSNKPRNYLLDSGDVLGIFVEGVLGQF